MTGWKPIPQQLKIDDRLEAYPTAGSLSHMIENGILRRRHLPHIDVEGHPYFITACLAGSISAAGMSRIRGYRQQLDQRPKPADLSEQAWEIKKQKLVFKKVDQILDGDSPVQHFANDAAAKIVHDAFRHFADERYFLLAFVVMPSHHHWLFNPTQAYSRELAEKWDRLPACQTKAKAAESVSHGEIHPRRTPREAISHSIQSFTASRCNRVLGLSGDFWQAETFDHYARDEAEVLRIVNYIETNPVKAGLVTEPHHYRWSSARCRHELGLCPGQPIPKVG